MRAEYVVVAVHGETNGTNGSILLTMNVEVVDTHSAEIEGPLFPILYQPAVHSCNTLGNAVSIHQCIFLKHSKTSIKYSFNKMQISIVRIKLIYSKNL